MNQTDTHPHSTDCSQQPMLFDNLGSRQVVADFSGGYLSRAGGALVLRQIDRGLILSGSLAGCFADQRDPRWVEHSLRELLSQRLIAMALGYEDLNDHNQLRRAPLLAAACGKDDPLGANRGAADRGQALASAPTLNRLELGGERAERYHQITHDPQKSEQGLLTMGVRCLPKHAKEVIVDLDATGRLLPGQQQGRFFSRLLRGRWLPAVVGVCGRHSAGGAVADGRSGCERRGGGGVDPDRGGDSAADAGGADHRASGQRFLSGGTAGVARLLKVAAEVRVSVRRVPARLCSAVALQGLLRRCHQQLGAMAAWDG